MEGKLVLEIRVPPFDSSSWKRLAVRFFKGPIPLFISLIALIVVSIYPIYYHTIELVWISRHDAVRLGDQTGFEVRFGQEVHKTTWLPASFYRGPHHQLAIAAGSLCIAASIAAATFYILVRQMKSPLTRRTKCLIHASIFLPTLALTSTAVLWSFIQTATSGLVDGYHLYLQTTPRFYTPYRGAAMNLEAWTCGVRQWVNTMYFGGPPSPGMGNAWREIYDMCNATTRGRWMLLPMLGVLVLVGVLGFVAVRAVGEEGGYERVGEGDCGRNGRVRGPLEALAERGAAEREEGFEEGRVRLE